MNNKETSPQARARLLIVDDDPGTVRLLARILASQGDIFFASSGSEALSLILKTQPDIVLLDAEMPDLDGFEVCAEIKSDPAQADLPVIFVTSRSDIATETRALEMGAVDFISKPLSPPIVQARVRTHLLLKQRTDELRRLATSDGLTRLANRRAFEQALDQEWRRATRGETPLSLLMIDVDFFKDYNDRYGHPAGDDCLRAIAGVLAATARRTGDLAARYGGEEFTLLLPYTDAAHAETIAESVCRAVRELHIPHAASDVGPEVTVSIGIASLPVQPMAVRDQHGQCCISSPSELIAAADQALYAAKAAGRNRVCHASGSRPEEPHV